MSSQSMFQLFLFVCGVAASVSANTDQSLLSCTSHKVLVMTNLGPFQVGCTQPCSNMKGMAAISEDGEECIDITRDGARKMPRRLEHRCPTGQCIKGTCKPDDLQVLCWYTGKDDATTPPRGT
uniref:Evasin n=1 Tax=Amblyomma triste TaxID=251400 RepID=A0A023G4G4_AMBTT